MIWCGLFHFLHYGNIRKYRAIRAAGDERKRKCCDGYTCRQQGFAFLLPFFIDAGIVPFVSALYSAQDAFEIMGLYIVYTLTVLSAFVGRLWASRGGSVWQVKTESCQCKKEYAEMRNYTGHWRWKKM